MKPRINVQRDSWVHSLKENPLVSKISYPKLQRNNENMSQQKSPQLVDFTVAEGVDVILLEDLKSWRPKEY